jgi:hypothetical protein
MKKKEPQSNHKSEEYQNFERFTKQILSVPKSEIDKREAEYQKARKATKKRKVA